MALQVGAMQEVPQNGESMDKKKLKKNKNGWDFFYNFADSDIKQLPVFRDQIFLYLAWTTLRSVHA